MCQHHFSRQTEPDGLPKVLPWMLEGADATRKKNYPGMDELPLRRESSVWTDVNGEASWTRNIWAVK